MTRSTLILLALSTPLTGAAQTVTLDGATWRALQPPDPPEAPRPPGPIAADRQVRLTPVDGGVRIEARWRLEAARPGWLDLPLLRADAHVERIAWDGREASAIVSDGSVRVAGQVHGDVLVELVAVVPGDPTRAAVSLPLLPSARGAVQVDAPGHRVALSATDAEVVHAPDGFWTGAEALSLALFPERSRTPQGDLFVAQVGTGVTVGDAALRGRARVALSVRRGSVDAVALRISGVGDDLDVVGPGVRAWTRSGDTVQVALVEPVTTGTTLSLSWTRTLPDAAEATVPAPRIDPVGAFRTERTLQLARGGEIEVVPALSGWEARPASALPGWGSGLVDGTPTSSWWAAGQPGGEALRLYRFEPVAGPPVLVDVAAWTVATSADGRSLVRGHLEVRNERAATLRVTPPAGARIVGARVGGEAVAPSTDGRGGWLLPLPRSVETVRGLLSFPVEVVLLGEGEAWTRRGDRPLALPRVDAPVAIARTTVHLPPGFGSRSRAGEGGVVTAFTEGEGIAYGLGVGEVGSARADAVFQGAVRAWMDNDFDEAQAALDTLRGMGAGGENLARLQSNLDVVEGRDGDDDDVALARRIKEQARARSADAERRQQEVLREAEAKKRAGDHTGSARLYRAALEVGEDLAKLEQDESVEVSSRNARAKRELEELAAFAGVEEEPRPASSHDFASQDFAFSGEEVDGDLVRPESAALSEPVAPPAPNQAGPARADRSRGRPGRARPAAPPAAAPPAADVPHPNDALPAPEVTAATLSVVVPAVGEPVLFQRRLIPAGADHEVVLRATPPRRGRR